MVDPDPTLTEAAVAQVLTSRAITAKEAAKRTGLPYVRVLGALHRLAQRDRYIHSTTDSRKHRKADSFWTTRRKR